MKFKAVYRVVTAIDFEEQRERELFYTENRTDAEKRYAEAQKKVREFGEKHGLKVFDLKHNENYLTIFADGNHKWKPYTGAIAEFSVEEFKEEDFLDLGKSPIF